MRTFRVYHIRCVIDCPIRAKHRVKYAFQVARTMIPRMARLYAKAITRSVANIAVQTNSLDYKISFSRGAIIQMT